MTIQKGAVKADGAEHSASQHTAGRDVFRQAMSRVVAAVHIVATDGIAGLAGMTASAVAPVSDEPATMLVCVGRTSHSAQRFIANGVFCVNTLGPEGEALAEVFAGRTGLHLDARFAHGRWDRLATGAPALTTAVAAFDCRLTEALDVATHHVLFGEVVAIRLFDEAGQSLAYVNRHYRRL